MRSTYPLKTTIEIPDDLARKAKAHAERENVTLHSLIERGLRLVLRADSQPARFKLRDASVDGRGLQPPSRDAEWARIRQSAYEDSGPPITRNPLHDA